MYAIRGGSKYLESSSQSVLKIQTEHYPMFASRACPESNISRLRL
jgi:hypothetical protein